MTPTVDSLLDSLKRSWTLTPSYLDGERFLGDGATAYVVLGVSDIAPEQRELEGSRVAYTRLGGVVYVPVGTGSARAWELAEELALMVQGLLRAEGLPVLNSVQFVVQGKSGAKWGLQVLQDTRLENLG